MATVAPPPASPPVGMDDDGGVQRLHQRLFQIMASIVTVVATGWVCTLGILPAIIALMVAKHILVAILLGGLGVDEQRG